MHVKHANTVFPGDRVTRRGQKTASTHVGEVADAGTADEQGELRVRVEWADGTHTFELPELLEKV